MRTPASAFPWLTALQLAAPFIVIGALYAAVTLHCNHIEKELEQRLLFLNILPDAQSELDSAEALIHRFAITSRDGGKTEEELRLQVDQHAQATGFQINTLSIDETSEKTKEPQAFRLILKGEGSLASCIRFLDALQGPDSLLEAEKAEVRTLHLDDHPLYEGEFRFTTHDVAL